MIETRGFDRLVACSHRFYCFLLIERNQRSA